MVGQSQNMLRYTRCLRLTLYDAVGGKIRTAQQATFFIHLGNDGSGNIAPIKAVAAILDELFKKGGKFFIGKPVTFLDILCAVP